MVLTRNQRFLEKSDDQEPQQMATDDGQDQGRNADSVLPFTGEKLSFKQRAQALFAVINGNGKVNCDELMGQIGIFEEWLGSLESNEAARFLVEEIEAREGWKALLNCTLKIGHFDKTKHGKAEQDFLSIISNLTLRALTCFSDAKKKRKDLAITSIPQPPKSLVDCAKYLHNQLFALGNNCVELQRRICKICELVWVCELSGREGVVTQCISMLLIFSLVDEAKKSDLKRVFQVRKMLQEIDFDNDSSLTLKQLLLRCFLSALYLDSDEGVKFLSELCILNETFIIDIHATIKSALPLAARACGIHGEEERSETIIGTYATIYHNAWRNAASRAQEETDYENVESSSRILEAIEKKMIQDLMDLAVHTKDTDVCSALAQVLGRAFHEHKHVKGVDEMLLRLYNPILWRSFEAANSVVRFNATRLLANAFPLQNPDASTADTDEILQKQFSIIETLLKDTSPKVRVMAIQGACRMLSLYWELIPSQAASGLLSILVGDLLHDGSNAECRATVLKGLEFISENPLSLNVLQDIFQHVSPFIFDKSKAVRGALINLLLRIKSLRSMKFYEVVKVEYLLEALVVDRQTSSKLTKLLLESFFLQSGKGSEQLERALSLAETNPKAALRFFENLNRHIPTGSVCKLIMLLGKWISNEAAEFAKAKSRKRDKNEKNLFVTVLHSIAVLWASVGDQLRSKRYQTARKQVLEIFTFEDFVNPVLSAKGMDRKLLLPPLLKIVSQMPRDSKFGQDVIDDIKSYKPNFDWQVADFANSEDSLAELKKISINLGPALSCLCFWDNEFAILDAIANTLEQFCDENTERLTKKRKVSHGDGKENTMDPFVALWCMQYMLANNPNSSREKLLKSKKFLSKFCNLHALRKFPFGLETLLKVAIYRARSNSKDDTTNNALLHEQGEEGDRGSDLSLCAIPVQLQDLFQYGLNLYPSASNSNDPLPAILILTAINDAEAVGILALKDAQRDQCYQLAKHCGSQAMVERFQARFSPQPSC